MNTIPDQKKIAILGGTGKEGKGLAYRWVKAGYSVIIGSRSAQKALQAVADLSQIIGSETKLTGTDNLTAAQKADIIVLTVPYSAHREMLASIKDAVSGKVLIDVTVPLVPPKVTTVFVPPAGSAAQEAREILGDSTEIGAAFQNISHEHLLSDEPIECEVLVCGTHKSTRNEILELVEAAGMKGWDAGPIENAVVIEGLTAILIGINKTYKVKHAGIRITGAA